MQNLSLAGIVILVIILTSFSRNIYFRAGSVFIGIVVGYIVALFLGIVHFQQLRHVDYVIHFRLPFHFGMKFALIPFIPVLIIFFAATLESIGDITAIAMLSGEPIKGKKYFDRLASGMMASGLLSVVAAMFGAFPYTCFSQNVGVVQMTGVASRYIAYLVALLLILCGIFPVISGALIIMPSAVLGGAMLIMFGSIAAAGVKIIATESITHRAMLIMTFSFALAFASDLAPQVFAHLPTVLREILSSGITTGCMTAIILNLIWHPRCHDAQ